MKLVKHAHKNGHIYYFYCPGCGHAHSYTVGCEGVHANWTFHPEGPSFTPSLRVYTNDPKSGRGDVAHCHLHVTNGQIAFCNDCPHQLNGKTVDLPDFTEGYGLQEPYEVVL